MDVTKFSEIEDIILAAQPDIFLHAAAMTRPMAMHGKDPVKSIRANIIGTSNAVLACVEYGIKIVYISTNYVYPGIDGDYTEDSPVLPFNKYAWSKLGGECAVRLYDNHLILRMSMNRKPFPHPKALVDVTNSFMFNDEAAGITLKLLNEKGTINVGGPKQTVYEFVRETQPDIGKIMYKEVKDVKIGKDTSMDISKLQSILGNVE
jgi:dTDP-4-dehydrorhamnose reductase